MVGLARVGLLLKTILPVPVSSDNKTARLALVGVAARNVATPEPKPEIPLATGSPVALVRTAYEGVPKFAVVSTGLVERTKLPEPVSSVIIDASCSDVVEPN